MNGQNLVRFLIGDVSAIDFARTYEMRSMTPWQNRTPNGGGSRRPVPAGNLKGERPELGDP
jgi:hypothetical protein